MLSYELKAATAAKSSTASSSPSSSSSSLPMDPKVAKVLVVGAGGIGCELLKDLVLSGFKNIDVVDLDVIELSNLNRQFLFRRHHIGHSKARVAAESVKAMSSDVNIIPYWANIKDTSMFPLRYFMQFDLVLNALDNLDARRYVNNMCLAANVPLIESGTAGYLGQTSVILPQKSECFDCTPKEQPKTFPVCTIRTTPSTPIHCVVWVKDFLLPSLFAIPVEENYPSDIDEMLLKSLKKETMAFQKLREMAQSNDQKYAQTVFDKVFGHDIHSLLELQDLWEGREAPKPLEFNLDTINEDTLAASSDDDHEIWNIEQWISLFKSSIDRLCSRVTMSTTSPLNNEKSDIKEIFFDKDDEDTMDFVAASANIRAYIFNIPLTSRFTLKSMAGNIIPAIATTNAIVAGAITLQAMNILEQKIDHCYNSFVTYGTRRGTLFANEKLSSPSPTCAVCHIDRAIISLNVKTTLLGQLIEKVINTYTLASSLPSMEMEDVTVIEGSRILFDIDMDNNVEKSLEELACGDSRFIKFDFLSSNIPLLAVVNNVDDSNAEIIIELALLESEARLIDKDLACEDNKEAEEEEDLLMEPSAKIAKISISLPIEEDIDDDILVIE